MNRLKKIGLIASAITIFIAIIAGINKVIFTIAGAKDLLYSKNGNYYQWRFGKIFYTKQGKGEPVLLIHDLSHISSDYEFKNIVNKLSEDYTVYTIDLIGCGRSDKPKLTYTSFLYVQLLNDFIKNIIGSKTSIISTSKSANLVILACNVENSLYNNLILINPEDFNTINKIPINRHKIYKWLLELPIIGTTIYNIKSSKYYIRKQFNKKYLYNKFKIKSRIIDSYYEAAHLGGANSKFLFSSITTHYTNANIYHALKEINNNITIIAGENEENINETINQYKHFNPAIESAYISKSKHLPQIDNPNEFIETCKIYL